MHKLLAQQVAKAADETGSVDLEKLFALVGAAYEDFDRDRRRTDRSISLMIEEIDQVQRNLEQTVVTRTKELRQREAELEAQNMRFDAAISNMSQGLVMFDAQARLVICNPRFIAMYRLEAEGIKPGDTLAPYCRAAESQRHVRRRVDPDHFVGKIRASAEAGRAKHAIRRAG